MKKERSIEKKNVEIKEDEKLLAELTPQLMGAVSRQRISTPALTLGSKSGDIDEVRNKSKSPN